MSLYNDMVSNIERRKIRRESGKFNAIPCPFPKLSEFYSGIEKGKYEMVTANKKAGKTQFTDYMYVYHPVQFCMNNESDLDIEIHYLCLEMTKEQKMMQAMCHFLFVDSGGKIRVSPEDLRSKTKPLDQEVLDAIIKYEKFFLKYLDRVHYHDNYRSVSEIRKFTSELCQKVDPKSEKITELILDHFSLVIPNRGQSVKQAIDELSATVMVQARNLYKINPVMVQQQANDKESFEAKKLNDLLPSFNGLSDSKDTARDVDVAMGIFSPYNAKMQMYSGVNVNAYKDNLRILNIIGGRESTGNKEVALYFDGAVSCFRELERNQ